MKGGYIMIDCKGLNLLAQSSQTIAGLYARTKKALEENKPRPRFTFSGSTRQA